MAGEVARLFVEVGGSVDDAVRQIRTLDSAINNIGKSVTATGAGMTAALTVPLAGIGGAALAASAQFESSFAGIRKTVEFTRAELDAMGHSTGDMAKDTEAAFADISNSMREMAKVKPIDVNELNAIGEAAGALGIRAGDIMAFTDTVADMGVTTNMTSGIAADMMARFANVSGLANEGSVAWDRMGATIVDLGNKTAATELEIMKMGVRIAGAGTIVGLTADQTMSFAAALASVGIRAEAGGSSMSTAMIKMSQHVTEGGAKLETLARTAGMTAAQFKYAFEDNAALAINAFTKGLAQMDAASDQTFARVQELVKGGMSVEDAFDAVGQSGTNVFNVLKELGLGDIRVRNAMLALGNSGDLLTNTLNTGATAWANNSALAAEAGKRYATVESQMQLAKNRAYDVAITLGDAMRPALMVVMQAVNQFIVVLDKAAHAFAALPAPVRTTITLFLGAVAAAGPMLTILGLLISAVGALVSPIGLLAIAVGILGGAFASNIGGFRDMVAQFINGTGIIQTGSNILASVVNGVRVAFANLQGGADPLTAALYGISAASSDFWGTFWALVPVVEAVRNGLATLASIGQAVQTFFADLAQGMSPLQAAFFAMAQSGLVPVSTIMKLGDAARILLGIFQTAWAAIGTVVQAAVTTVVAALAFAQNNFGYIIGAIVGVVSAFSAWGPLITIASAVWGAIGATAGAAGVALGTVVAIVAGAASSLGGLITSLSIVAEMWGASAAGGYLLGAAMSALTGIFGSVLSVLGLLFSPLFLFVATAAIVAAAWQTNSTQILGVAQTLVSALAAIANIMAPVWTSAFMSVLAAAQVAFGFVPQIATVALGHIQSIASSISVILVGAFQALAPVITTVFGMLPGLTAGFMALLGSIIGLVGSALAGAFSVVAPIAVGAFSAISNAVVAVLPALGSIASTVMHGLTAVFTALAPVVHGVFAQLASAAQTIGPILAQLGTSIGTSIGATIQTITPYVQSFFAALAALAQQAGPAIINLGGLVGGFLVAAFRAIAPVVATVFAQLPSIVAAAMPILQKIGTVLYGIAQGALAALGQAIQFVSDHWDAIASVIGFVGGVLQKVAEVVGGIVISALNDLNGAIDWAVQAWGSLSGSSDIVRAAMSAIGSIFSGLGQSLGPIVSNVVTGIKSAWSNGLPALSELASTAWENVKTAFASALASLPQTIASIVSAVKTAWSFIAPALSELASTAWENVKAIFGGIPAALAGLAGQIVEAVKEKVSTLVTALPQLAGSAVEGIKSAFMGGGLGTLMGNITGGVAQQFQQGTAQMPTAASTAWSQVESQFAGQGPNIAAQTMAVAQAATQAWSESLMQLAETSAVVWMMVGQDFTNNASIVVATTQQAAVGVVTEWTNGIAQMVATTGTGWASVASVWVEGAATVSAATTAAWVQITTAWASGWQMDMALDAAGWAATTALWTAGWTTLSTVTTTGWTATTTAWTSGWTLVTTLDTTSWSSTTTLWTASWTAMAALTTASWTAVSTTWTTNWTLLTTLDLSSWAMTTALWTASWLAMTTLTQTSWMTVSTAWSTSWAALLALDAASWAFVLNEWTVSHGAIQQITTDSLAVVVGSWQAAVGPISSAAQAIADGLSAIADACDDIKDAAEDAMDALAALSAAGSAVQFAPDITPGSPPPMAYALWDMAAAGYDAASSLQHLSSTGSAVNVAVNITVNDNKTDFLNGMQALADMGSQMVQIVAQAGKNIDDDAKTAVENLTQSVNNIVNSFTGLMDAVVKLIEWGDANSYIFAVPQATTYIIGLAQNLSSLAVILVSTWASAGKSLNDDVVKAAQNLGQAVQSATQGMTAVTGALTLLDQWGAQYEHLLYLPTARTYIQAVASGLSDIAGMIASAWGGAGMALDEDVPAAAKALADSIASAAAGFESTVSALETLAAFTEKPIEFSDEMAQSATTLAANAVELGIIWSNAAYGFDQMTNDGVGALASTLDSALTGYEKVVGILQALAAFAEEPVAFTAEMKTAAGTLADQAVELGTIWAEAAVGFDAVTNDGTGALSDTLGSALDGYSSVIDLLSALAAFAEKPIELTTTMKDAASTLVSNAIDLATTWANAAVGFELVANDGTAALSDTLQSALDGYQSVIGLLQALAAFAEKPIDLTAEMKDAAETLAGYAVDLATTWANVAVGFELVANDGTGPLGDTVQSLLDGMGGVIGLLQSLASFVEEPIQLTQQMGAWAYQLMTNGLALATAWAGVAVGFDLVANDGTGALADTLGSLSDGLDAVVGLLQLLASFSEEPIQLTQQMGAWAYQLMTNGLALATAWAGVAVGFDLVANDGTGPLADTLGSLLDGMGSVVSLLELLASFAEQPIQMTTAMGAWAGQLMANAVALATAWAGVARGFELVANDGTGPLADTLTSLLSGMQSVVGLLQLLSSFAAEPIQMTTAMGAWAGQLMDYAVALGTAWAGVARGFELVANDGTGPLADTLDSLAGGLGNVVSTLKVLSSFTQEPIQMTTAMGAWAGQLMANAVALATAWAGVARGFELVANDGTDAVAKTIDSLTGSLSSVISTLKVLSTFVQEPIQMTTAMGAWAGQLIDYAVALATAWATAAEGFDLVANDGVAALSDTLSSVDDGFAGVIAVLKVLAQFAQEPITLTDQMKTQAGVLAGNAVELATAWATAALGFDMIANDGVGALSDTVGSMADGLEGTIGVLKTLASFVAEPVVLTDAMITAANTLSAQAVELATIWAGVALNFDLVTNDGVGPLADTIGSMSDGLESTIGVLTTLASFVEEPIALTDAMKDAASTLASNALELGTIWAGVAQNFDVIANDGVSALADTISSANDGIGSVVELLNLFASLAEDPVVIVENVGQQMYDLASYAYELGQIFADVAGGFDTIANDGVPALADTISSAADGIASVIEIMQSISTLAERPIPLPQNWTNMAQDILDYARVVADALVEAARGFDEIAGDQAKAMADAAGSAFDAIGSALETFPKMATFLGGFIGLTDGLRTQLRLLMQTIVLVFKEFAQAALDADITQAAQDAAAALSDGFGSAVSALKDAFDLWDTLVGGDAPRMGFNMVNPQAVSALLDPYFDFIEMVFQEFANRAANYDMTDLQAATDLSDAVSSVFDAINSVFEAITSFQGVNAPTYSGGSSGVMNIGQVLDHIFSIFEENVGRGQAVQSIANSLSAAVGAIVAVTAAIAQLPQNVDTADLSAAISAIVAALAPASARMGPLGFEMGTSLGKGIADGIRSQKDDIVAALREVMSSLSSQVATGLSSMVPSGATRTLPPGTLNGGTQGSGGTTVNYNYYTTNNYSLTQNVDPTTAAASSQSFAAMEALS